MRRGANSTSGILSRCECWFSELKNCAETKNKNRVKIHLILDYDLSFRSVNFWKKNLSTRWSARVVSPTKTWERTGHIGGRVAGVVHFSNACQLPRRLLKHWVACSKRSDSFPRFYFFALLFTSHRSSLSERLEQAKHWGAFHRKFGKSGKWYTKSRKSVQKFRKLLNFRNANLTIQPKILEIPGAKLNGKKTSGKKFF